MLLPVFCCCCLPISAGNPLTGRLETDFDLGTPSTVDSICWVCWAGGEGVVFLTVAAVMGLHSDNSCLWWSSTVLGTGAVKLACREFDLPLNSLSATVIRLVKEDMGGKMTWLELLEDSGVGERL